MFEGKHGVYLGDDRGFVDLGGVIVLQHFF